MYTRTNLMYLTCYYYTKSVLIYSWLYNTCTSLFLICSWCDGILKFTQLDISWQSAGQHCMLHCYKSAGLAILILCYVHISLISEALHVHQTVKIASDFPRPSCDRRGIAHMLICLPLTIFIAHYNTFPLMIFMVHGIVDYAYKGCA